MIHKEIINKVTGEKLIGIETEDFEYVDPIKFYGDNFIVKCMILRGVPKEELFGEVKKSEEGKKVFFESNVLWRKMLANFDSISVPENLTKLFTATKKKEQVLLLEGVTISPDIFMSFIMKAHREFGFTLSQYSSEYLPNGVDSSKIPVAFKVDDNGDVKTFGKSELSSSQLKQVIEHRKVKVAKFLDKGDEWHCFFLTFKSLRGEETWLGEKQPHYHYISHLFGIERSKVVEQLKSEKYSLGNLPHIKLIEYGKQPNSDRLSEGL